MTPCCVLLGQGNPSKWESTLKGKNWLQHGANSFLLELTPIGKGGKKENGGVTSPENVPIHLKVITVWEKRIT